jgi:hypothetical protein
MRSGIPERQAHDYARHGVTSLFAALFSVITRQAIRRPSFTSVKELVAAIGAFIDHWNEHPVPFAWTKEPDEILSKIERAKTKTSGLTYH